MSLRWESALITKVAEEQALKEAVKAGIELDDFEDNELRNIWMYVLTHYQDPRKGGVPSIDYLKSRFPGFQPVRTSDSLNAVVERIQEAKLYTGIRTLMDEVKGLAQSEDAHTALAKLKDSVMTLSRKTTKRGIADVTKLGGQLRAEYMRAKELKGITGMEYPWPIVTSDTGGAKGGELVTFMARPGSLKTWVLLAIAWLWYELGYRPLVLTKEMTVIQLTRRLSSLATAVDYRKVKKGCLSPKEEAEYLANLDAWSTCPFFPVAYIQTTGKQALMDIRAYVEETEPDGVFIDGGYFLGERDWGLTGIITSGLAAQSIEYDIPYIANNQLSQDSEKNKGSYEKTTGGAYGDSWMQDSSVVYKLRYTKEDKMLHEVQVYCVKMREDEGHSFSFNARPGGDLRQKHVIEQEDDARYDTTASAKATEAEVVE